MFRDSFEVCDAFKPIHVLTADQFRIVPHTNVEKNIVCKYVWLLRACGAVRKSPQFNSSQTSKCSPALAVKIKAWEHNSNCPMILIIESSIAL